MLPYLLIKNSVVNKTKLIERSSRRIPCTFHNLSSAFLHVDQISHRCFATRKTKKKPIVQSDELISFKDKKVVILVEKPSMAVDIADALGIRTRKSHHYGDFEKGEPVITWASGHICTIVNEASAGESKLTRTKWTLSGLPLIPPQFYIQPITSKKNLMTTIETYFKQADEIICATDAGREGELIFRLIYEKVFGSGLVPHFQVSTKERPPVPFKRLWISSLTPESIIQGFKDLRNGSEFNHLYESALGRQIADWFVGINATRGYTLKFGKPPFFPSSQLLSVGRVQTPVLKMVVDRYHQQQAFKSEKFWRLLLKCESHGTPFAMKWFKNKESAGQSEGNSDRLTSRDEAEKLAKFVQQADALTVEEFTESIKTEKPPKLFDLNEIQKELNRSHSWSAAFILSILQQLYETRKAITYPRTSSRYLSQKDVGQVKSLLTELSKKGGPLIKGCIESIDLTKKLNPSNNFVFDDSKIGDHTAIILTNKGIEMFSEDGFSEKGNQLSKYEKVVLSTIMKRMIVPFLEDNKKNHLHIVASATVEDRTEMFQCTLTRVHQLGWKALSPSVPDAAPFPKLKKGEIINFDKNAMIEEKETTPPANHTDASLLHLMQVAGRELEDEQQKDAIIQSGGLGTPSTRAGIIERLIDVEYMHRSNANPHLIPSTKGIKLIGLVDDPALSSAQLTGEWERRLNRIKDGQEKLTDFLSDISKYVSSLVRGILAKEVKAVQSSVQASEGEGIKCGICHEGRMKWDAKKWMCSKCSYVVPSIMLGKKLSSNIVNDLMTKGETGFIGGFVSKTTNKKFKAKLILKDGKTQFSFK